MAAQLLREQMARSAKRSLGFPEPVPVFVIGNWPAYVADMARRYGRDCDLMTFQGHRVERGGNCGGFWLEWRAR